MNTDRNNLYFSFCVLFYLYQVAILSYTNKYKKRKENYFLEKIDKAKSNDLLFYRKKFTKNENSIKWIFIKDTNIETFFVSEGPTI